MPRFTSGRYWTTLPRQSCPQQAASSVLLALSFALAGCGTTPANSSLDPSMVVLNMKGPFVSREFAQRLALLVIDQKYPKDAFVPSPSVSVDDNGELWSVGVDNALPSANAFRQPRHLTIRIRKTNGEILSLP